MAELRRRRRHRRRHHHHHRPPITRTPTGGSTAPGLPTPTPTPTPTPGPTPSGAPTTAELTMLNRFGTGYTPGQLAELRAAGGPRAWFEQQLAPTSVTESPMIAKVDGWFPDRLLPAAQKSANVDNGTKSAWAYARELSCWTTLHRIYAKRTLLEVMTDFWSDNLHVRADHFLAFASRADYDQLLRGNALGRFEDLLKAAALHPAMLYVLDNYLSTRGNPNENQGRELLEIHTVGRTSGYTEAMVHSSAIILSGWTVDENTWQATYDPTLHTTGPVTVLDFSDANAASDGSSLTLRYLSYLANHPATAANLALKLAHRFVSENPSQALLDNLTQVYLSSGTDISAVLRALVASDEFAAATPLVRTSAEDTVATARALGVKATGNSSSDSFAVAVCWSYYGDLVFFWPRPDGPPRDGVSNSGAARMSRSMNTHWSFANGWWPTTDVTYATPASWLPSNSIAFSDYVDHLSLQWLGRPASELLQTACRQATGVAATETITPSHPVAGWLFGRLAGTILDTPFHMSR